MISVEVVPLEAEHLLTMADNFEHSDEPLRAACAPRMRQVAALMLAERGLGSCSRGHRLDPADRHWAGAWYCRPCGRWTWALLVVLSAAALVLWAYFRPRLDRMDLSLSVRGLDWRREYWARYWYGLFALRCYLCGRWGGCGEHWLCGLCRACEDRLAGWDPGED